MTAAAFLHLDLETIVGLLAFGACVFVAGWVLRGEHDLYGRARGGVGRRWADSDRDRGGFIDRTPW